jgi:hypothetical protein
MPKPSCHCPNGPCHCTTIAYGIRGFYAVHLHYYSEEDLCDVIQTGIASYRTANEAKRMLEVGLKQQK